MEADGLLAHSVQLTTFPELGRKDYRALGTASFEASQERITPADCRPSALELETRRTFPRMATKQRALYDFVVSAKFSATFPFPSAPGDISRMQRTKCLPNWQYGDCKDKHTLLATMLKAVGIEAWPALIGAGLKFDADVPSPAQFNHLITVIGGGANPIWLDTTAEVAPFGMLMSVIRAQQALVIPASGAPVGYGRLRPIPPFPSSFGLVESSKTGVERGGNAQRSL